MIGNEVSSLVAAIEGISRDRLIWMYEKMVTIRYFEEAVKELYKENLVRGSTHLYIGEEAVAVGACEPLLPSDYVVSTHRGHGHCIAKGGDVKRMMAELLGKATGYCRGKGGSMHIADVEIGILGANGIVGGGIPIATGAGLSCAIRGQGQVVICFFGDAACNQGSFHESINLAAAWKLPVIYLCENNLYGVSTKISEACNVRDLSLRATGYGIPGVTVDGNDVLQVRATVIKAIQRARAGRGPTLIEAKTYRWEGHYVGDPCIYRSEEEVKEWCEKDPIRRFEQVLLDANLFSATELESIRERVTKLVSEAIAFAKDSPDPPLEALTEDIYASFVEKRR